MSTASDATKTGKLRLGGSNLWLFLLLASMILFGVNTGVATWQGSRLADAGSKAADLQVLSQQLANQGRDAVGGNAQAFTAFKATRNAIEQNVSTLQGRYGKEPGVSGAIATLAETWAPLGKQAGQLVASEPAVLALAGNANNFTGAVPGLQAQLNELVRAMSASGAPSSQGHPGECSAPRQRQWTISTGQGPRAGTGAAEPPWAPASQPCGSTRRSPE